MSNCPCGSGCTYENCCGALHCGNVVAVTAQDLMRSRYSAFVVGDVDYLLNTHAPEYRPVNEREEIAQWSASVQWLGLDVIECQNGGVADDTGYVEFVAHYREEGQNKQIREKSLFRKTQGVWFYVTGELPREKPAVSKEVVQRNAPCPCGSGKKYKKCCGRGK